MKQELRIFVLGLAVALIFSAAACDDSSNDDGEAVNDTSTDLDTATDADSATTTDVATDADSATTTDVTTDSDSAQTGLSLFGETCAVAADCADTKMVCTEFGQLGMVCTFTCETEATCPEGSQGKKCNKSGFCRP